MKKWPKKDDKPISFSAICEPIRDAILFAYDIKRKNANKNIPYKGYDIGYSEQATCCSPNEKFTVKNMKYSLEDQGRDALDEIITVAVQLGIEQGRRVFKSSTEYQLKELTKELRNLK